MKTTSITPHEAAKIINRQFNEDKLVYVVALTWPSADDDERTQFELLMLPYRIEGEPDVEGVRRNAAIAAHSDICAHPFVERVDEIGKWLDSEHGYGARYRVTVK